MRFSKMSDFSKLLFGCICVRVISAFLQRTYFVPDEHWQSLEVAHNFVFGYGYLTWEWRAGIRSYLYPLIFSLLFKILQLLHIDSVYMMTLSARLLHSIFAIICDVYTYWLARDQFGDTAASWTFFFCISSWFMFYCMSRTLINSLETVMTTVAIYYFFRWQKMKLYRSWPVKFVLFASLSVMIRPTSAIQLLPLFLFQMLLSRNHIFRLQQCYFVLGLTILSATILIDRLCYGRWVFVPYKFLLYNLVHGLGTFYGSHPWHWYLTNGLSTVLGIQVVPAFFGALKLGKHMLTVILVWTVFVYSLLGHKEHRFLLPVVPLAMCLAGFHCANSIRKYRPFVVSIFILTNVFPAAYFSAWHQRGPIDVMDYLSSETRKHGDGRMNVLYLMPCHSTPYYSHIHENISMRFLTCDPSLDDRNVTDEAELFYDDPSDWLRRYFDEGNVPSHVVAFDVLFQRIRRTIDNNGYKLCRRLFHSHVKQGRTGEQILVFCK